MGCFFAEECGSRLARMPTSQNRDVGHPATGLREVLGGVAYFVAWVLEGAG